MLKNILQVFTICLILNLVSLYLPYLLGGSVIIFEKDQPIKMPKEIKELYNKEMFDEEDSELFFSWVEENKKRSERSSKTIDISHAAILRLHRLNNLPYFTLAWIAFVSVLRVGIISAFITLLFPFLFLYIGLFTPLESGIVVILLFVKSLIAKFKLDNYRISNLISVKGDWFL